MVPEVAVSSCFTQITDPDPDWPIPAMAGHTMSRINDFQIWLIGGFSTQTYFTETVYQYDTSSNVWSELSLSGSQPTGTYKS